MLGKSQAPSTKVQTNYNFQIPNTDQNTAEIKLLRLIVRFPEVVRRAQEELAPQFVATYLIELAGEFHSFYSNTRIADAPDQADRDRRLLLTAALAQTIKNGLWLLGIETIESM